VRRLAALGMTAVLTVAGCGGASSQRSGQSAAVTERTSASTAAGPAGSEPGYLGGTVKPITAAPELGLRTWDGRRITMADYKGKAVLVTFLYVHCPDVCPLIVDNLSRIKARLGPAGKKLRIVAVSVDPTGDTPAAVKKFLITHRVLKDIDYLVGSQDQLTAAWSRWGIGARVDKQNHGLIEHSAVIWGIDAKGRRATFYPATGFDPADIESDVRLLLKQ
jgi:protein SCO1/2